MSAEKREIDVQGRKVILFEAGAGAPLVYLHGFADIHGVAGDLSPFHKGLARNNRLLAPAHPGCNGSVEFHQGNRVEDFLFHYCEVFDALGLDRFALVGHCAGGWLAAEYAVRHPERVTRLVLIGASGLFVPREHIGDIFMNSQPDRGASFASLRHMLFASADAPQALRYYPDGRGDLDEETRRYGMLRFGSAIGFRPPYFYNRPLVDRLHRACMPALIVWGTEDHMVPLAHGKVYAERLGNASALKPIAGAGHAAHLEKPAEVLAQVTPFLAQDDAEEHTPARKSATGRT
jgi:pimeloyl-ACP methyl ester carboxylesterase